MPAADTSFSTDAAANGMHRAAKGVDVIAHVPGWLQDSRLSLVRDTAIFSQGLVGRASRKSSPAFVGFNTPEEIAVCSQMFDSRDQGIMV